MLAGDPGLWLQRLPDIEAQAVDCIAVAWPKVLKAINGQSKENDISRALACWLQKDDAAIKIGAIRCLFETPDLELDANLRAFVTGRTDLRFLLNGDPDCDLVFECKRLRVRYPSGFKVQADSYTSDGLTRFSSAQYSSGIATAGMLGYVMDGNAAAAVTSVQNEIANQASGVKLVAGSLAVSPAVAGHPRLTSVHARKNLPDIEVRHTFLAV